MQTGSSWVQSNISPSSQVPKYGPGKGANPQSVRSCLQMSALEGWGMQWHPTQNAESRPSTRGRQQLPHSSCSVTRPELQVPSPAGPGPPLLLSGGRCWHCSRLTAQGVAVHSPLRSPTFLPPMISWVGLFWGVVLGGGGSNIYFGFFWQQLDRF